MSDETIREQFEEQEKGLSRFMALEGLKPTPEEALKLGWLWSHSYPEGCQPYKICPYCDSDSFVNAWDHPKNACCAKCGKLFIVTVDKDGFHGMKPEGEE